MFSNVFFFIFRNTIRMSNSFDQDQALRFVWPNPGPNFCKDKRQMTKVVCYCY